MHQKVLFLTDILTKSDRSILMSRIKSKDTNPEIVVRKILTRLGYRYRIHRKDIPGTPDIAFIGLKKVIFIHGCFWHRHVGCKYAYVPKSNVARWNKKFKENIDRDNKVLEELKDKGWNYLIIWECQLKNNENIPEMLKTFLGN